MRVYLVEQSFSIRVTFSSFKPVRMISSFGRKTELAPPNLAGAHERPIIFTEISNFGILYIYKSNKSVEK